MLTGIKIFQPAKYTAKYPVPGRSKGGTGQATTSNVSSMLKLITSYANMNYLSKKTYLKSDVTNCE